MIIYGDQNVKYPNHCNFGKYVLEKLRTVKGDGVCLENGLTREKLTYRELVQFAVNLSAELAKLGVTRGNVVAIGSDPFLHFIPTALAVVFTGAAYTAYDENIGREGLKHKLQLVKPKFFICSLPFWNTYSDLLKKCDCIKTYIAVDDVSDLKVSVKSLASFHTDINGFEPADVQGKTDTAVILYSSGTTGMPKGVELSHVSCIVTCLPDAFENMDYMKVGLITYSWSINLFLFMTFKMLLLGRKIVYTKGELLANIMPILRELKVDIIFSSPVCIRQASKNVDPSNDYFDSVKMIYNRSFPLQAETIAQFKKSFPKVTHIIQAFGLTECGEPMSQLWGKFKPGSVGPASPGMIIKVVDPETRAVLGPNHHGEICVKGLTLMKGYLDIERMNYLDEDGFYKTGDLGYYDEDKHFYIVDRITDVINFGGYKISPVVIENILVQHPAVLDVGVVGRRGPLNSEVPMAFVVKKPEHEVSEKELIDFVASKVSPWSHLRGGVKFILEVPRNARGKTLRRKLKEMVEEPLTSSTVFDGLF